MERLEAWMLRELIDASERLVHESKQTIEALERKYSQQAPFEGTASEPMNTEAGNFCSYGQTSWPG